MCKSVNLLLFYYFGPAILLKFYLLFGIEISDDIINVKNEMTLAEAKEVYAKGGNLLKDLRSNPEVILNFDGQLIVK